MIIDEYCRCELEMGRMMQFGDCFVIGPIPIAEGFEATFHALAPVRTPMSGRDAMSTCHQEV